ncbi:fibronectin type III domain-containing protein 11-like [Labrus mixtus]|uniref:fibronectin type III domain-containing protein 11-like n=1 Tax=Labrus mixtus TaxID=508554 RepID=UPI0029C06393|nr:fibronectin type III domain-containing protein 11-like [Labrus mixtus]
MDEVNMDCSDRSGDQRDPHQVDQDLVELRDHILQLLNSKLNCQCIRTKLVLMQNCSYYLEIQHENVPQMEEEVRLLSDGALCSLINQQRLTRALIFANTHVKLLLSLLESLFQHILRGCRELCAFMEMYDQNLLDRGAADSAQQTLQQTLQYADRFEDRMVRNLGQLKLQDRLIPNTGSLLIPKLTIKLPVTIDRSDLYASVSSVHLSWTIPGEEVKDPEQQFEVEVKCLHPTTSDTDQISISKCQAYNTQVTNLIPDRYYMFSVMRENSVNLVYGLWKDLVILKTLAVSQSNPQV